MQAEFRRILESGDVDDFRAVGARCFPHFPRAATREQAEVALHYARTLAEFLALKHRAWSHRWLTERLLPSGLPDHLKPSAERLYPVIVEGVGIAVGVKVPKFLKSAANIVQGAMSDAVEDIYADDRSPDPVKVKGRMFEVKADEERRLFGIFGSLHKERIAADGR